VIHRRRLLDECVAHESITESGLQLHAGVGFPAHFSTWTSGHGTAVNQVGAPILGRTFPIESFPVWHRFDGLHAWKGA